jgi:hypothetical protein
MRASSRTARLRRRGSSDARPRSFWAFQQLRFRRPARSVVYRRQGGNVMGKSATGGTARARATGGRGRSGSGAMTKPTEKDKKKEPTQGDVPQPWSTHDHKRHTPTTAQSMEDYLEAGVKRAGAINWCRTAGATGTSPRGAELRRFHQVKHAPLASPAPGGCECECAVESSAPCELVRKADGFHCPKIAAGTSSP